VHQPSLDFAGRTTFYKIADLVTSGDPVSRAGLDNVKEEYGRYACLRAASTRVNAASQAQLCVNEGTTSLENFGVLSDSPAGLLKLRIDAAEQFLKAGFGACVLPTPCARSTAARVHWLLRDRMTTSMKAYDCGNVFAIHEFFEDLDPVIGRVPVPIDREERDRHAATVADYKEHGNIVRWAHAPDRTPCARTACQ
jgi:hypothetical protein